LESVARVLVAGIDAGLETVLEAGIGFGAKVLFEALTVRLFETAEPILLTVLVATAGCAGTGTEAGGEAAVLGVDAGLAGLAGVSEVCVGVEVSVLPQPPVKVRRVAAMINGVTRNIFCI
jgi:hypothetical protein